MAGGDGVSEPQATVPEVPSPWLEQHQKAQEECGRRDLDISIRTYNVLCRAGYVIIERGPFARNHIDVERLAAALDAGALWQERGVGDKTLEEICRWMDVHHPREGEQR